jgi:hypothetical protein
MRPLSVASASFAEFDDLNAILAAGGARFESRTVGEVRAGGHSFPILTAAIGSNDPKRPPLAFLAACTAWSASVRS